MKFNKIEQNFNKDDLNITITLNANEIEEILRAFRALNARSKLRSNLNLLLELVINGATDMDTFNLWMFWKERIENEI